MLHVERKACPHSWKSKLPERFSVIPGFFPVLRLLIMKDPFFLVFRLLASYILSEIMKSLKVFLGSRSEQGFPILQESFSWLSSEVMSSLKVLLDSQQERSPASSPFFAILLQSTPCV